MSAKLSLEGGQTCTSVYTTRPPRDATVWCQQV